MAKKTSTEDIAAKASSYRIDEAKGTLDLIRFNRTDEADISGNKRDSYGFEPEHDKAIVELIHGRVNKMGFTKALASVSSEEKDWILSNLGDASNDKSMAWLMNSIIKHGVIKPIHCLNRSGLLLLTDGNTRLTAIFCILLTHPDDDLLRRQITAIKIEVESQRLSEKDLLIRQYLYNSGRNLSPVAQGKLFASLSRCYMEYENADGNTISVEAQIAEDLGMGANGIQAIKRGLDLVSAMPSVVQRVEAGEAPSTEVVSLVRKARAEGKSQIEVAETVEKAVTKAKSEGRKRATASDLKHAASETGLVNEPQDEQAKVDLTAQIVGMVSSGDVKFQTLQKINKLLRKDLGV